MPAFPIPAGPPALSPPGRRAVWEESSCRELSL
jgi:hypothetical protein